jgi:uncharacterized GH25 family protein
MTIFKPVISLLLLACMLYAIPADAHSLFIQSGRYKVADGRSSPLFFCYGHHVPVDDAVRRKKFSYIKVTAPDKSIKDIQLRDEKSLHSYLVKYDQAGTHVLTAETNPGKFSMYYDHKGRKRHSFKPLHKFKDNAKEIIQSLRSSQWAKTYVVADEPSKEFPAFAGLPFELVPSKDVTMLKEGESIEFQIYSDGKPYTGEGWWDATYAGFSTEAEDNYIQKTHSAGGKFTLPIDHSGRWFVRYFTKTPAAEENLHLFLTEKRTATLTFEVRNERRRPRVDSH